MKLSSCLLLFAILNNVFCVELQSLVFYKYKMINESIDIGKVSTFGHDVRQYSFKTFQQYLTLDKTTGMLRTIDNAGGLEIFNFNVLLSTSDNEVIEMQVILELNIITEELIRNSGSFQIQGSTPIAFINSSREESVSNGIARYLIQKITNTTCNVLNLQNFSFDIFSIVQNKKNTSLLDVRFIATSKSNSKVVFYHQTQIHWIILENQEIIEELFQIKITSVNIDECINEGSPCESSCFNDMRYIDQSPVIFQNYSSFQGIEVQTKPVCENQKDFDFFNDIRDKSKLINLQTSCPIFYQPINPSESYSMSLSVYPNATNGIILYFGQKYVQLNPSVEDFLLLKVVNGHPTLIINAGSGETVISSKCILTLHHKNIIFIIFDKRNIEMIVQNSNSLTCKNSIYLDGKSKVLNINTPIQLGAANQKIFKKLQSYVLNAKISNVYISNINKDDNINHLKQEGATDKILLNFFIGILILAVIILLYIVKKDKIMITKLLKSNHSKSFVVSYDNSKETIGSTHLQNQLQHQHFKTVEVMSPYSNVKDVRDDDSSIYTIIPYEQSSDVIRFYGAAFKNQHDNDSPSIYAEVAEFSD